MQVWVDGDACPRMTRAVIVNAAQRRQVFVTFVANRALSLPGSPCLRALQVPSGFDAADAVIAERAQRGDLVITADIPLAAQVIDAGVVVITPRGELLTADNIKPRLSMRDFLEQVRSSGENTGGPLAMTARDKQAFANAFDRALTKALAGL